MADDIVRGPRVRTLKDAIPKWYTRKRGEEGIYAEPPLDLNVLIEGIAAPMKVVGKLDPGKVKKFKSIIDDLLYDIEDADDPVYEISRLAKDKQTLQEEVEYAFGNSRLPELRGIYDDDFVHWAGEQVKYLRSLLQKRIDEISTKGGK